MMASIYPKVSSSDLEYGGRPIQAPILIAMSQQRGAVRLWRRCVDADMFQPGLNLWPPIFNFIDLAPASGYNDSLNKCLNTPGGDRTEFSVVL